MENANPNRVSLGASFAPASLLITINSIAPTPIRAMGILTISFLAMRYAKAAQNGIDNRAAVDRLSPSPEFCNCIRKN